VEEKRSSNFGIGLLLGAIGGALAGLFLAPKAGKLLRQDAKKKYAKLLKVMKDNEVDKKVKQVFGKVTKESKKLYIEVKEELMVALANLKEQVEEIDRPTYVKKVEETIGKLKSPLSKQSVTAAKKLKDSLSKDWDKLAKAAKKPN